MPGKNPAAKKHAGSERAPQKPTPKKHPASPDAANPLRGTRVVVAGAGATGLAVCDLLLTLGATVTLADRRFAGSPVPADLSDRGVTGRDPERLVHHALADFDMAVTSPGFPPDNELLVALARAGVPVWGEVELAWRLDRAGMFGPPRTWLAITGTNGKTTTTAMTEAIVAASGRSAVACGNIGLTVVEALRAQPRADVLCVELSSFQLHWAPSVCPDAGVVLNVADDHLDWHGSFDAYAAAKARVLRAGVAVVGLDDRVAAGLPAGERSRRVGFTLAPPAAGELGVVDGVLVDRAFADDGEPLPADAPGTGLLAAADVRPSGPSGIADALAAAALARAIGVPATAVREGLAGFEPAAHRGERVAEIGGVEFIDDSKATNPHAAQAAVLGHTRVVLIAGGLLKGAPIDDFVATCAERLAGIVVIGADRQRILDAIERHAPQVPAVTVFTSDDGAVNVLRTIPEAGAAVAVTVPSAGSPADAVMAEATRLAWDLARSAREPVDAVLLAPAAASLDMFANYGARGDSFASAATALAGASGER